MNPQKMLICVLICFFISTGWIGTIRAMNDDEYEIDEGYDTGISVNTIPLIHVNAVSDGVGLSVIIKNRGENTEKNIDVMVHTENGLFLWIPRHRYHIDQLPSHSSECIHIPFFGFGIGKLAEYPEFSISVKIDQYMINKTLITRVYGPYCTILGERFNTPRSYQGYTLFSPEYSTYTFLMNNDAEIIHEWDSNYIQGLPVYLDEEGNLIRACSKLNNPVFVSGGFTGRVELRNWNNELQWEFDYSTDQYCLHHDIEPLPNGNILMISWEGKSVQEAVQMGRNPSTIRSDEIWPDKIIEVKPIGSSDAEIVWEWHVWDHLIQDYDASKENYGVVTDHPELVDINYGTKHEDWTHINGIDYNPEFDQIILSVHNFNEVWVIDHSTTTEEAAGHTGGRYGKGGDLLYRWGNPQAYQRGAKQDQQLFGQHDAQWVEQDCPGSGNIIIFNNGVGRPDGMYSSIEEITPPITTVGEYKINPGEAFEPTIPTWSYAGAAQSFYSGHISGVQRLPNGNTLICEGDDGIFFEVTPKGHIVWSHINTVPDIFDNHVFKIKRYPLDYPGIQ